MYAMNRRKNTFFMAVIWTLVTIPVLIYFAGQGWWLQAIVYAGGTLLVFLISKDLGFFG
jgi:hypothetical protein